MLGVSDIGAGETGPSLGPVPDGKRRSEWGEVDVGRADEQDQGDDPISRRYCLSVSWSFVKHFRQ